MNLTQIDIRKNGVLKNKVKALYVSAFPKYERVPWSILRLSTLVKGAKITGFLDGDEFCGFTHSVEVEGLYFVMFFAVEGTLRSKGYGSAILSKIKEENPDKTVALNVELLDRAADNYPERVRRVEFYKKNGFFDTGYNVREVGGEFRVLATKKEFDTAAYKKVFKKLTFGLWNVWLEKVE